MMLQRIRLMKQALMSAATIWHVRTGKGSTVGAHLLPRTVYCLDCIGYTIALLLAGLSGLSCNLSMATPDCQEPVFGRKYEYPFRPGGVSEQYGGDARVWCEAFLSANSIRFDCWVAEMVQVDNESDAVVYLRTQGDHKSRLSGEVIMSRRDHRVPGGYWRRVAFSFPEVIVTASNHDGPEVSGWERHSNLFSQGTSLLVEAWGLGLEDGSVRLIPAKGAQVLPYPSIDLTVGDQRARIFFDYSGNPLFEIRSSTGGAPLQVPVGHFTIFRVVEY